MVLHELCTALNKLGHQAGLVLITEGSQQDQGFKFGYSNAAEFLDPVGSHYDFFSGRDAAEVDEFVRNACIIYPDIIKGNPLNGRNFVTYVLGKPGFPIESQFVLAYSEIYIEKSDYVLFKPFVSEWMHARDTLHWTQRKLNLTYVGKGQEFAECSTIPGTVLIERDWPKDKRQLAALLRNCKYFFSWDSISATNIDAALCGAVPVLMQDAQIPRSEIDQFELGALPPVSYEAGMEDAIPSNLAEIDAALANTQHLAHHLLASWQDRVQGLVHAIQLKLE
ncbi:hypothetical protein LMG26411_03427 [Cupriavidus numazuensis]|uniref:Glycosyltransferase n=2 Tax=Cupriavidus numazuensis TaxID=221992 RepID=A0ABM8TIR3_9BURK|nr:hypothetical protein LMG26411_03427 [Cupriavidus numazuensis]